jgi:hypothetical protein
MQVLPISQSPQCHSNLPTAATHNPRLDVVADLGSLRNYRTKELFRAAPDKDPQMTMIAALQGIGWNNGLPAKRKSLIVTH